MDKYICSSPNQQTMSFYRSKIVEIQAVQLNYQNWNEVCALLGSVISPENPGFYIKPGEESETCGERGDGEGFLAVNVTTMHGEKAIVRHGDYIIPDGKPGTFYPCKPDVFRAKYQPMNSAGNSFAWALQQLQAGAKVARAIWGGYWRMESASINFRGAAENFDFGLVVAYLKDGGLAPAQPYWQDMLANDWRTVE